MTMIETELRKWKRNKIVWGILALTILLAVFAINRACSISRSSPYMDSFGDLYTLAFKNLTSLFLPIVLGMFATTLFFDEQKNDTLKELLIIPISKAQLYFTKVAVVILMSVVLCMVTFLLSVLGGFVAGGFPDLNAESLLQSALLYLTGGVLVPVAMLPIIFLATLSKGYVLPIGNCSCLSHGTAPAGKRNGNIHTIFPCRSRNGRELDTRGTHNGLSRTLFDFYIDCRHYFCWRIGYSFKKAILLKGKSMKRIFIFLCSLLLVCSLCACQEAAPTSSKTPDQQELIDNATAYFNQMLEGNFDTLYSELPKGVQEKTSAKAMQADWSEEIEKVGGLPEDAVPDISCYVPEKSEQNRVEFVIPCEKGDFKVFINYSADGSLYNYVIWKNNAL